MSKPRGTVVLARALPCCANVPTDFISRTSAYSSVKWVHCPDPLPGGVGGVSGIMTVGGTGQCLAPSAHSALATTRGPHPLVPAAKACLLAGGGPRGPLAQAAGLSPVRGPPVDVQW